MIGQGALPGDALAAHLFRITYRRAVGEWIEDNRGHRWGEALLACDPITGRQVDLAMTVYADDIRKTTPVERADELPELLKKQDEKLTQVLSKIGVAQSSSKKEHVLSVFGAKSGETLRAIKREKTVVQGKVLRHMVVLGSVTHNNGSVEPELKARMQTANSGWFIMGAFWTSTVRLRTRLMIFLP